MDEAVEYKKSLKVYDSKQADGSLNGKIPSPIKQTMLMVRSWGS